MCTYEIAVKYVLDTLLLILKEVKLRAYPTFTMQSYTELFSSKPSISVGLD